MERTIGYKGEQITVNSDGTIIWNGTIRNHHLNADGYPCVTINTEKGWRQIGVARLIASAFIDNPDNLSEVHHKNFDRTDYSIENLQWVTHADNIRHSKCNKPDIRGDKNPNYGNHKLSAFYKAHPEIAKIKQGRTGEKNGRYVHGKYVSEKCNDYPEGVA